MRRGGRSVRIWLAVILATLTGAATGTIVVGVSLLGARGLDDPLAVFGFALTGLWWGFWPAVLAVCCLGLPVHEVLKRRMRSSAAHYALAGLATAAVIALIFVGYKSALWWAVLLVSGTLSALVFWLVRRPDRDAREARL